MKILIDHQAFSIQKYGGVSRIFAELYHRFKLNSSVKVFSPFLLVDNEYFRKLPGWFSFFVSGFALVNKVFRHFLPKINNIYTLITVRKADFDIYFPSYYDCYFLEKAKGKVLILFVFDMIHELYPEMFGKNNVVSQNKRQLLLRATKVIAISHNTKSDILRIYPDIPEQNIEVVHLSHSLEKHYNKKLSHLLPENYILFVGSRSHYKNFKTMYSAFKLVLQKYEHIKLLCVGGGPFTSEDEQRFIDDKVSKSIIHMNVNDRDLYQVYNNSIVFVFPSLYEGFGIPVVEAMYAECPIILGELSSFPEIACEAGIYCNVENDFEIAQSIFLMIEDKEARDKVIAKGVRQAAHFSWTQTAEKSLDICIEAFDRVVKN